MHPVRVILWTAAMAYTGFLLTGQRLRTFQQPLNYGSIPGSFDRIFTRYHVHSPGEAATKTYRSYISYGTSLPELGQIP